LVRQLTKKKQEAGVGLGSIQKLYWILTSILIFIVICYILFFTMVCRILITYASMYNLGGDFIHYYVAALMAARGKIIEVYNTPAFQSAIAKYVGYNIYYWVYPPTFLILLLPLTLLPYLPAFFLWISLTLIAYLLVVHHIAPRPITFLLTLAFPATFYNVFMGQNGFLTASFFGAGLVLLENRPFLGGILLGLISYKPQFAILMAVALIVGRQWRALLGAASSALGLALISVALFGARVWLLFYRNLPLSMEFLSSAPRPKMVSLFASILLMKGGPATAWILQGIIMLAAVAVLFWGWRRGAPPLRKALLVLLTLLFSPHAFYYDLTLLALPLAWIGWQGHTQGWLPGEQTILTLAWLLPFLMIFRFIEINLNLPLSPLILLALVILVLRRQYSLVRDQNGVNNSSSPTKLN
jgi:glycosyl transferase family 87